MQHLPWVLLGLWTIPHERQHVSSAEMVYGDPLVLPGEFFPSDDPPGDATLLWWGGGACVFQ